MSYTFHFGPVWQRLHLLLDGFATTIWISAAVIAAGFAIGVAGGFAASSRSRMLRTGVRLYVGLVRNTPLLAQLFFVYFGLPGLGLRLDATPAALVTLALNLGGYTTEIVRGGIDSVPRGQTDAGAALGLTRVQVFVFVVLRPALKVMFPALTGQFTLMMLATSVISTIGITELFHMGGMVESETYRSFESYIVVCAFYLAFALVLRLAFAALHWLLFAERVPSSGPLGVAAP